MSHIAGTTGVVARGGEVHTVEGEGGAQAAVVEGGDLDLDPGHRVVVYHPPVVVPGQQGPRSPPLTRTRRKEAP